MQTRGYWLDAHSAGVPTEVMDIAANLLPALTNLGAVVFELLPEHLPSVGLDAVQRQVEGLQQLWALRPPGTVRAAVRSYAAERGMWATARDHAEVAAWEVALADAIGGRADAHAGLSGLVGDPGCALLRDLIVDFRRANLARALHYTMTALLAGLGPQGTHELLDACFAEHPPEPFGSVEADLFAHFLRSRLPQLRHIAHLEEVLSFEHALVRATVYDESTTLSWTVDPTALCEALDAGRLPTALPAVATTMRVCAE